jgi:hypothetical protein
MNHRRWIALAAVVSALMCAGLAHKAAVQFGDPPPLWMTDASRWHDDALAASMYAVAAAACAVYLYRIRQRRPLRWRDKVELRVALYCFAVLLALQLPLGFVQAFRAVHDQSNPPPGHESFFSLLPVGGYVGAAIVVALIVYDRRRTKRDRRDAGYCMACGYDLRATPYRYPECGTPVRQNTTT